MARQVRAVNEISLRNLNHGPKREHRSFVELNEDGNASDYYRPPDILNAPPPPKKKSIQFTEKWNGIEKRKWLPILPLKIQILSNKKLKVLFLNMACRYDYD